MNVTINNKNVTVDNGSLAVNFKTSEVAGYMLNPEKTQFDILIINAGIANTISFKEDASYYYHVFTNLEG